MDQAIEREADLHGEKWNEVHGGYFSNPDVAAGLIDSAWELAIQSKARTVVDLGGGTGFLLARFAAQRDASGLSRVVVDPSVAQLASARQTGVTCVEKSLDRFCRDDLAAHASPILLMMRSVLHYLGRDGLQPALRHLRRQMRPGEFFVHQTAAFEHARDAQCLNQLYGMMRTEKWYPPMDVLRNALEKTGWEVRDIRPAPPLQLDSAELAERYQLTSKDLCRIRTAMRSSPEVPPDVFCETPTGFRAFLHYWIIVCTPAIPSPLREPETPR